MPSYDKAAAAAGRGNIRQLWEAAAGFPDEVTTCGVDRHVLPGLVLPFAHGAEILPNRAPGRCVGSSNLDKAS